MPARVEAELAAAIARSKLLPLLGLLVRSAEEGPDPVAARSTCFRNGEGRSSTGGGASLLLFLRSRSVRLRKGEGRFSSSSRSYSGAGLDCGKGRVAAAFGLGLEAMALVADLVGTDAEWLCAREDVVGCDVDAEPEFDNPVGSDEEEGRDVDLAACGRKRMDDGRRKRLGCVDDDGCS